MINRSTPAGKAGPSQRQLRVGELIRHALAELLARGAIMDEEVNAMMITVPEVRITPDLKHATIFVTALKAGNGEMATRALSRHKRWLRGQIAQRINLKFAPDLTFRFDDRFEESARIDALLHSPEVRRDLKQNENDGEG